MQTTCRQHADKFDIVRNCKIMHSQRGFYFDTIVLITHSAPVCEIIHAQASQQFASTLLQTASTLLQTANTLLQTATPAETAKYCYKTGGSILTRFLLHHADNMLRLVTHSSSEYEIMHDQRLNVTTQSSSVNSVRLFV